MTRWMSAAALGLAIASAPAWAHHAISAIYDSSKRVTVEGAVQEFQFINPHPFLIINVTDAGKTLEWRLEMDNRFELIDEGMSADTLKPGDRVVATGSLSRTNPQSSLSHAPRSACRWLSLRADRRKPSRAPGAHLNAQRPSPNSQLLSTSQLPKLPTARWDPIVGNW